MLRLAGDADVHGGIIRGVIRRLPQVDLVRVQDALPEGVSDPQVLVCVAAENRVLLTNDRTTMISFAYERVRAGQPMPGLVVTTKHQSIGAVINDIVLITKYMSEQEIADQQVVYLPLRS